MGGKERLLGVQYLRAIAALMVAYFHLSLQIPAYAAYLAMHAWIDTAFFQGAVPVFFVISGFVMYVSGIENRPSTFVWKRLARIVPLYWALTLIVVMLTVIRPGLLHTRVTGEHIAKSLLFVPYFAAGSREIFPILGPGWSLDYEVFFYAMFAAALFVPLRSRLATMLLVLAVLYSVGTVVPSVRENAIGLAYTSGLLLLFGFGLLLGRLYRRGIRLSASVSMACVLAGLCLLVGSRSPGWAREYVAPVGIVLGVISLDASGSVPSWPWLVTLGDASYSIYLVHPFALDLVSKLWRGGSPLAFAATALALIIVMALVTYRFIERPTLKLLTRPVLITRERKGLTAGSASMAS